MTDQRNEKMQASATVPPWRKIAPMNRQIAEIRR
jgi:hypothetical protein